MNLKLTFWTLVWMLSTIYSPVWSQTDSLDSAVPMSLEECLAYAYENSANMKNALLDIGIAKNDIGVTKSQGLPQINGSVVYNNNYAIQTQFLPAVFFADDPNEVDPNAPPVPVRFGVKHTGTAGITASQMIFDGSYFIGLKAARTYTDLAKKDFDQSKLEIAEQVTKAYYSVLVNQERQQLIISNFNRLDTLLRETQLLYDNGFVEKIDVDRIKVQYNNIKSEAQRINRLVEVSRLLLKFQMGMPIEQDVLLSGSIREISLTPDLQEEYNFDYNDRPEFAKLLVNKELVQLDIKNNRVQYLPKLSANAAFGYNTGVNSFNEMTNFSDQWFEYGYWGLDLNLPIFDGLRKHNQIQKAKLQYQQIENATRQLKNSIDLEVVQAKVSLQNALENLNIQEENMELAREVFRVTRVKYQEGVGSNIEVIDAENALKQSETNYYNALYDALIAKVDLKKSLGALIEPN